MSDSLLDHEAERHYGDGWSDGYDDRSAGRERRRSPDERGAFSAAYWTGYAAAYGESDDERPQYRRAVVDASGRIRVGHFWTTEQRGNEHD